MEDRLTRPDQPLRIGVPKELTPGESRVAGLMRALLESRCVAFALGTIRDARGRLPVHAPMGEIAGRLTAQSGPIICSVPPAGGASCSAVLRA